MSEKKLVIDQLRLNYNGLMNFGELFKVVDGWFYEKGFDKFEKKHEEIVLPSGKDIEIELRPWKKITDYAKHIIRIRMYVRGLKNVEIEKDGIKTTLQQGSIRMKFDAYLETDYENKWEQNMYFYFLRAVFDKYVYRTYDARIEEHLVEDTYHLHSTIKSYLNLHRY